MMIVVTGGAGFIGSAVISRLNRAGIKDIIVVDSLKSTEKWKNLVGKQYSLYLDKSELMSYLNDLSCEQKVDCIIHMGACSSTTEKDADYLMMNNYRFSIGLAEYAVKNKVRFIYASSAATYGDGNEGFSDDLDRIKLLKPLNMYGYSKQMMDEWVLHNNLQNQVVGIKFFNVFGPNEYHKGDMKSVIYKSYYQILAEGTVRLFKSYKDGYADGEQKRDFVYVKDCIEIIYQLVQNTQINGIYNLGTGKARTWKDLATAVFKAMNREPNIEFVEMPEYLREKYQYYTQADMRNLSETGIELKSTNLEDAVKDYVQNYLMKEDAHL